MTTMWLGCIDDMVVGGGGGRFQMLLDVEKREGVGSGLVSLIRAHEGAWLAYLMFCTVLEGSG